MATHWPKRRERCSHGSFCPARWSASSLMFLWLPWVLLWLPSPTEAEQVGGEGHGVKALHGSLSSPSYSSSSSSSSNSFSTSGSAPWAFSSRQSVGQLDWLLSEKGPFHRCPEYTEFKERFQQGFSTRYKIYRWEWFKTVCLCVYWRKACILKCGRKIVLLSFTPQQYFSSI